MHNKNCELDTYTYPHCRCSDSDWLRDLAERLRQIPVAYGIDEYDIDRCIDLARKIEKHLLINILPIDENDDQIVEKFISQRATKQRRQRINND